MRIYLCRRSALVALRYLRRNGVDVRALPRGPLGSPSPAPYRRWVRKAVRLDCLPSIPEPSDGRPLEMAVPSLDERVRMRGVVSVMHGDGLPHDAFLRVADGVWAASPELVLMEMGPLLTDTALALLGYELCGTFVPKGAYELPPASSVASISSFIGRCRHVRGTRRVRQILRYVRDNAWSPMEAVLALVSMQEVERCGYGLGSVTLNRREPTQRTSRVPDIMFDGTHVGINYDGRGHYDLQRVADAARRMEADPGSSVRELELRRTISDVRAKLVDDARRDRELRREGLLVLPAYYEDLAEEGALDLFMDCVMRAIEEEGSRDLSDLRTLMGQPLIARQRQQHVWSMLGGRPGAEARRRRDAEMTGGYVLDYQIGTRTGAVSALNSSKDE